MNKYKVIILSLLISFMGASCEDWLYDNVNEDAAHEVLPQQVLPVVLFYSAQLQFDHAEYGAYLTQTLTTGGRNQTSSFAYKSGWGDFLTMNRHPQWRRHFYDIGVNAKEIIDEAHEAQAWNLELIGRTLRLMSTQMTTDLFGDMPRSEAYESNSPHYDTQESIYEWMNQEIEELIGMYEDPTYTEAATNIPIDQSIDRVFAGDLNKWKHYTYALKARLLLRKLPNWENNAATCQAIITAVNRALEGWEDVLYRFDGGNVEKAQSDAKKLIDQHENLKGIFGCSNTSTIGIASELLEENRKDIVLVGFDMADITVQIIQNPDYFAGTLMQRQDQMGYLGLTALYDFVSGSRYEQKYFDTGVVLIDADYLSGRE